MLKKIFFITYLFNVFFSFSQDKITLDSLITEKRITPYLHYYQDLSKSETLKSIENKKFSLYADKTFPGQQKQKIWFKLSLKKSENENEDFFFLINTVAIEKLVLYQKRELEFETKYEFYKDGQKNIEIPFHLIDDIDFLFEVQFSKCIYFPLEIKDKQSLEKLNKKNLVIYGLYYGFVLLVLIINIFFYWQTRESFFLCYIFLAISIALILFELDGFVFFLFEASNWIINMDILLHVLLLVSVMFFTNVALRLDKNLPKVRWLGVIIIVLNLISFLVYLASDAIFWYSLGEFFNLIGLLFYLFAAAWFFKKLVFARFMFLGYSVIYITSFFYVLPSEFGMIDLGFSPTAFKIGSIIEMIVFLYAISFRHQLLSEEKNSLTKQLKLHKKQLIEHNQKSKLKIEKRLEKFKIESKLTRREIEVLDSILKGKRNKEIAKELFISVATVKYHCAKLYTKTEVKNRSELINLLNVKLYQNNISDF